MPIDVMTSTSLRSTTAGFRRGTMWLVSFKSMLETPIGSRLPRTATCVKRGAASTSRTSVTDRPPRECANYKGDRNFECYEDVTSTNSGELVMLSGVQCGTLRHGSNAPKT